MTSGPVPPLVGAHEIREILGGLSRQRIQQITGLEDFPGPVLHLGQGRLWRESDVRAWKNRRGTTIDTERDNQPETPAGSGENQQGNPALAIDGFEVGAEPNEHRERREMEINQVLGPREAP